MKSEDYYLSPVLEELVPVFEYKPNWTSYVEFWEEPETGAAGWRLIIVSDTENSLKPDERIRVGHPFLIPPASYNEQAWIAWLRARCADVENHELGEWFKIRGVRVFAPHHSKGEDPYVVWHMSDYTTAAKKQGDD